jgi:hypothetical protein
MFRPVERHELPLVSTRAAMELMLGLALALALGPPSQLVRELGLALGLVLGLGPPSQLVRELGLALGLVLGLGPPSQLVRELELALVRVFLERLASGSVGRVERVQSQHCCSACWQA